jgi:hypothetical protein
MRGMKTVTTYRAVDEFLPLAQQHGTAHVERLEDFHARGVVATWSLRPWNEVLQPWQLG